MSELKNTDHHMNPWIRFPDDQKSVLIESVYGTLWKAKDRFTDEIVALKVSTMKFIKQKISADGNPSLEDPLREAEIMNHLGIHPNVVQLKGVYYSTESLDQEQQNPHLLQDQHHHQHQLKPQPLQDQQPHLHWIAMEFVSGGDLLSMITCQRESSAETKNSVDEANARDLFRQILNGLHHLHSKRVAHLDLSWENILVTDFKDAKVLKLCDFGLAEMFSDEIKKPLVQYRGGKAQFMAPEVLMGGTFDAFRADMFSAGVILFILIFQIPPFNDTSEVNYRDYIAAGSLQSLLQYFEESGLIASQSVSPAAKDLILALLHPDPMMRPSVEQALEHEWFNPQGELS